MNRPTPRSGPDASPVERREGVVRGLLERWKDEPAPLLPLLHALHERDGHLSEEALRAVSAGLRIPIADLFGTVTFYHHFSREPGGFDRPRICNGPVCCMRGADVLAASLRAAGHDPQPMPCPGRCDQPVPVIHRGTVLTGRTASTLASGPSPLPRRPRMAWMSAYSRGSGVPGGRLWGGTAIRAGTRRWSGRWPGWRRTR